MNVTKDEMAERLVRWFKAHLAQTALAANPAIISESHIFSAVGEGHRAEVMMLVEQKVRASLLEESQTVVETFQKIGFDA